MRKESERPGLAIDILDELPRSGKLARNVNLFFSLERNPHIYEIFSEDATAKEIFVILLEMIDSIGEIVGSLRDGRELFRTKRIYVLVERRAGMDLVLDTIEASHENSCESKEGVGRSVRCAELKTASLRMGDWDTDADRAVTCAVGHVDGCLEARDETTVRVSGGIRESKKRLAVLYKTSDKVKSHLRKTSNIVFGSGEEVFAVLEMKREVAMHARSILRGDGLGHESGDFSVTGANITGDIFEELHLIGSRDKIGIFVVDFSLTCRRHFVMAPLNIHSQFIANFNDF